MIDLILISGGVVFVIVCCAGYWVERIVKTVAEQKINKTKELADQFLRSFQTVYDYLTEDVDE